MQSHKPTTIKQLQSFLSAASWFQKFIRCFPHEGKILYGMIKKDQPNTLQWDKEKDLAYTNIIRALQTAPVLRLFNDENALTYLLTDSSSIAYSSLLAQGYLVKDKDATTFKVRLFPVAYGGRSFSASEQNWSSSRLECAGFSRSIGNHADLLRSCVLA